uniref:Uncharacterized protein n=1 Tax=Romanomermis culicivorax TaxID=13658 RepID=A0A915JHR0_ROMCU
MMATAVASPTSCCKRERLSRCSLGSAGWSVWMVAGLSRVLDPDRA